MINLSRCEITITCWINHSTIFLRISLIGSLNIAPKTAPINIPTRPLITTLTAVQQEQHGQHGQHIFFYCKGYLLNCFMRLFYELFYAMFCLYILSLVLF